MSKSPGIPEIRIKDAWLLRENVSQHLHQLWAQEGEQLAGDAWMRKRVAAYSRAWQPYKAKVLAGMCQVLNLSFRQNIIDVYIAPWFKAFSDPLVIGVIQPPDEFIDTMTHELLHRLLTDNTAVPADTQLLAEWQKLFGKQHSFDTLIHIPVHAAHKAVYLDVLDEPKRLERDIERSQKYKAADYVKAWEYVEQNGYQEIIEKLKNSYARLGRRAE